MEIYTLDVYKTTESLVIKGFSACAQQGQQLGGESPLRAW